MNFDRLPYWTDKPIVATYSPCCKFLREGKQPPPVMHSGLCKSNHGGKLGETIYLTALAKALPESEGG